jgi:hypothetical protein
MDHIPPVQNVPRMQIPYLSSAVEYGCEPRGFASFSQFPRLVGYEIDRIVQSNCDDLETLALLQSWLFFGLLTEAFGGKPMGMTSKDFIRRTDTDQLFITTEALPKYFWYWQAWRDHLQDHEERRVMEVHAKTLDQCLVFANTIFKRLTAQREDCEDRKDVTWCDRNAVLLSIAVAAEWIFEARKVAANLLESYTISTRALRWRLPCMQRALINAGWCVGEAAELMAGQSTTCLYYLTLIDRTSTGKTHKSCSIEDGCKALQIDYNDYKLLHISTTNNEKCECKSVGPPIHEIAAVLDRGNIPLVMEHLPNQCAVLDYTTKNRLRYVAISHVWSDGLGNPKGNKLNACTFRHLQRLVNDLYTTEVAPVPFWIDTMCIPPQENHTPRQKELRKEGITRMAETYARADKVLVLDSSLRKHSGGMDLTEIMVRIRHAPWTTRVWTLQEGRLARNLYFQFKDRAICAEDLQGTVTNGGNMTRAMGFIKLLSDDEILSNVCARQLLIAFTSIQEPDQTIKRYAQLPPQDDEFEEDCRKSAQVIVQEHNDLSALREQLKPLTKRLGLRRAIKGEDEQLAADVRASNIDLVYEHGMIVIRKIRGYSYRAMIDSELALTGSDIYPSAGLLTDICAGFRGRTTSRLEDETVCLGILLQIKDLKSVLDIEPLNWRWGQLMRALGRHRVVRYCHERRMRAFLAQIEGKIHSIAVEDQTASTSTRTPTNALPQTMVFWNVPRLGLFGWNWAPFSFLDKRLSFEIRSEHLGKLTQHGLEVGWPAYKINDVLSICGLQSSDTDTVFVIHIDDVERHFRQSWQRLRLRRDDCTRKDKDTCALRSWCCSVRKPIREMAILIQQTRIEDAAVLVQEYAQCGSVHLTRHVALLERVVADERTQDAICEIHVSATWISDQSWRVG